MAEAATTTIEITESLMQRELTNNSRVGVEVSDGFESTGQSSGRDGDSLGSGHGNELVDGEVKLLMTGLVAIETGVDDGNDPTTPEGKHHGLSVVVVMDSLPLGRTGVHVFFL